MIGRLILVWVCVLTGYACTNDARPTYPQRRGGRGDPCLVLNDCKEPLLCRQGRCLDSGSELEATGKECVSAECLEDVDCCPLVSAADEAYCDAQVAKCRGNAACERSARRPCTCTSRCEAYLCVTDPAAEFGCSLDTDCSPGSCRDGRCKECEADEECGEGQICEGDRCEPGCTRDEQCGRLSRCEAARCVARGCVSQRECIALLRLPDAECRDEACVVPCDNDSACDRLGPLHVCQKGACLSLGCEENVDCSARDGARGDLMLCLGGKEAGRLRSGESSLRHSVLGREGE